ncbi:MAG TPA: branched-chain amino acid ABC transporter permease [Candidatus Tumulicola sp.]|nr:branched-chain amino acid ABC transporter permease [Candidatus Tumulicola sp.]
MSVRPKSAGVLGIVLHPMLLWAIVLALLPWVMVHVLKSNIPLATNMIIFAIIALGFNFLYGHTGELSFGHAGFVGLAGYAAAYMALNHHWAFFPCMAVGVALAMLLAFIAARIVVPRSTGIYFSMVLLSIGQVLYFVGERWNAVTGGDDGLQGVSRLTILPSIHRDFNNSVNFYILSAVIVWVLCLFMWRVVHSPFGAVCHAIRENRQRAEFLGYNVVRYKINAFVISALLPAFGGVLLAYYNGAVNPGDLRWTQSGDIVMMTLLGGAPTFWGPILGGALFKFLEQYLSVQQWMASYAQYWEGYIGIVFVTFVLLAPQGIWGLAESGWRAWRRRSA